MQAQIRPRAIDVHAHVVVPDLAGRPLLTPVPQP
jgi:hypothetical protein